LWRMERNVGLCAGIARCMEAVVRRIHYLMHRFWFVGKHVDGHKLNWLLCQRV
jgi:hypothetical protein